jgi:hypothetical protein
MIPFDLCKHLRWKTQSRDTGDPTLVFESLARSQVPFSCLKTCQCVGPDDDLVAPELCHSGRACFVRDPLSNDAPIA